MFNALQSHNLGLSTNTCDGPERLHRNFPFDSATFDFTLQIAPPLPLAMMEITNRVPGFVINCAEVHAKLHGNDSVHIQFQLHRSPLIQITTIVLALLSLA